MSTQQFKLVRLEAITQISDDLEATVIPYRDDAQAAQAAAETAQTGAETAETNAATSETNAAASATLAQDIVDALHVDSVSVLRGGTFPAEVERLWIAGYYGVGTPGGGPLYRDTADTTTADNGGTVFVGADGVRWKRDVADSDALMEWFGAQEGADVGSIFTDMLSAGLTRIRTALGSLALNETVTLVDGFEFVPLSHQVVLSTDSAITLFDGNALSGITFERVSFEPTTQLVGQTCINLEDCEDITVEKCRFVGGREGLYTKNCKRQVIKYNYFTGQERWGNFFTYPQDLWIHGNTSVDQAYDGIKIASTYIADGYSATALPADILCKNIWITGNLLVNNGEDSDNDNLDIRASVVKNLYINGNVMGNGRNGGFQLKEEPETFAEKTGLWENVTISDNLIYVEQAKLNGQGALTLRDCTGKAVRIRNNTITFASTDTAPSGINMSPGSKDAVVEGNRITNARRALRALDSSDVTFRDNEVVGSHTCFVFANTSGGFGVRNILVTGNRFKDWTSNAVIFELATTDIEDITVRDNIWDDRGDRYATDPVDWKNNLAGGLNVDTNRIRILNNIKNVYKTAKPGDLRAVQGEVVFNADQSAGSYEKWVVVAFGTNDPASWKGVGLIES